MRTPRKMETTDEAAVEVETAPEGVEASEALPSDGEVTEGTDAPNGVEDREGGEPDAVRADLALTDGGAIPDAGDAPVRELPTVWPQSRHYDSKLMRWVRGDPRAA